MVLACPNLSLHLGQYDIMLFSKSNCKSISVRVHGTADQYMLVWRFVEYWYIEHILFTVVRGNAGYVTNGRDQQDVVFQYPNTC